VSASRAQQIFLETREKQVVRFKVAIISLRINPAFIQHLIAYAKAVQELGGTADLLLDPTYRRFPELEQTARVLYYGTDPLDPAWTHAIYLNVSLENRRVSAMLQVGGVRQLYVYHEPWQMSLRYLLSEGLPDTAKALLAHRATVPVLKRATAVVLESEFGLSVYRKNDARINPRGVYYPQIYDDDAVSCFPELLKSKRYFSFIGNPCKAHGFEQYIAFVTYCLQSNLDVEFMIACRQELSGIEKEPLFMANAGKLKIRSGKPLSNDEMNRCYAESLCVWNLYRRSTQSGVLPKALMFGAPVVATRIGSFPEYIIDRHNGRFLTPDDHQGLVDAFHDFRANRQLYGHHCRETFLKTFYYRARLDDLAALLEMR
jgi:glycosyltransferase involved in cell wall biosynthesis